MAQSTSPSTTSEVDVSLEKVISQLSASDDTSRFVGLALLHSTLDNSATIRNDPSTLATLWSALPSSFVDRLLKAQASPCASLSKEQAAEMVGLAASVLHAFSALLPAEVLNRKKAAGRVKALVKAVLYCADGEDRKVEEKEGKVVDKRTTMQILLGTITMLVSVRAGAEMFLDIEDVGSLTEAAPRHLEVFKIFSMAWITVMQHETDQEVQEKLKTQIDDVLLKLVASFIGTDGVTLLEFVGEFLPTADPLLFSLGPKWLPPIVAFIEKLILKRPTPKGRYAYTICTSAILESFPAASKNLLFVPPLVKTQDNPKPPPIYLLINLVLIDIRTSLPALLSRLNTPDYSQTTKRLTAAYEVALRYIAYMMNTSDDSSLPLPVDLLYKTRNAYIETLTLTVEYLRDRWNAAITGAPGLDVSARSQASEGVHRTIAWDSASVAAVADPLVLSAIKTLAMWLSEDDVPTLLKSAVDLVDMFVELYEESSEPKAMIRGVDFRDAVLLVLEPVFSSEDGRMAFKEHGGWKALADDLMAAMNSTDASAVNRGCSIAPLLLMLLHHEADGRAARDEWLDLVTRIAAWAGKEEELSYDTRFMHTTALKLAVKILKLATKGQRKRYVHTMAALSGLECRMREAVAGEEGNQMLVKDLDEVRYHLDLLSK